MTFKHVTDEHGAGPIKQVLDRFHHSSPSGSGHGYYGGQGGIQHLPTYHQPPPSGHVFKHYSFSHGGGGSGKGGGGGGAAMSALTLLSFLFFLNILQSCLKDQMTTMTPQVMVMSSAREEPAPQVKQDKITPVFEDKTYTLIDGIGRAYPEDIDEEEVKDDKSAEVYPKFVNAMGDGVGEIITEQ